MPTLTAPADGNDVFEAARGLAEDICNRHRGHLRELVILEVEGGVVLHGRARSFYGKQIALHEARRGNLTVLANRIVVA